MIKQTTGELAIDAVGLVKRFGDQQVVDGISLQVKRGTIYGFLGPNGAGKTTTIKMLATLLRPDGGTATVMGHDLLQDGDGVRQCISLTGQFASVDEEMSGRENLILIGRLVGFSRHGAKQRATDLLRAFRLEEAADRQVKKYSGGMRRRIDIAASIVTAPDLLFLDEPTTGLDPRSRNQVWDIIRALVLSGTTVFLTTQYLEEADQLADRIGVIDHGRLIAEGTSSELKAMVGAGRLTVHLQVAGDLSTARRILEETTGQPVETDERAQRLIAQIADHGEAAAALSRLVLEGLPISDFSMGQPSLDEVFLTLTGKPAQEEGEEAHADQAG
ncbi:daunorubicin resistance protein DrrA family ABC transporter ATP-binding protein [Paenibacillus sp. 598K]|uniref:ATP-binding cassette domain-containing protein n=1 Tax=Paenibacillus sp. 598K TaxID=1117987 RepID=UPI000FFA8AD4|nr:ATP-binding cassette domain-containing protein [Paenibacillus sp. 598K]GBF74857.1 daunorubicin resistance protein DrrA family ABC transporter ATP-binding protein [Paenibacillus sp. 598K]